MGKHRILVEQKYRFLRAVITQRISMNVRSFIQRIRWGGMCRYQNLSVEVNDRCLGSDACQEKEMLRMRRIGYCRWGRTALSMTKGSNLPSPTNSWLHSGRRCWSRRTRHADSSGGIHDRDSITSARRSRLMHFQTRRLVLGGLLIRNVWIRLRIKRKCGRYLLRWKLCWRRVGRATWQRWAIGRWWMYGYQVVFR